VDIEVRFGSNASTTNVTLNGNFGGKDMPFIELEETIPSTANDLSGFRPTG
jgi:hypothetical protein